MEIKDDLDFSDLQKQCWSGAISTLKTVEEHDKEDELMQHLEEFLNPCGDTIPTMTEVNDYLWFESDTIFENLGIAEDEDEDEE